MQELDQKLWRSLAYWIISPSSLSLPSCTVQNHLLRGGTTQSGLGLPMLVINQDNTSTDQSYK